ncbi:hypothetical protein J3E72DRAFT_266018 [Bipolaris maydis]|nr:hypothetical protein J3E72DRAFT_266018 [Bipolaris maydis]
MCDSSKVALKFDKTPPLDITRHTQLDSNFIRRASPEQGDHGLAPSLLSNSHVYIPNEACFPISFLLALFLHTLPILSSSILLILSPVRYDDDKLAVRGNSNTPPKRRKMQRDVT